MCGAAFELIVARPASKNGGGRDVTGDHAMIVAGAQNHEDFFDLSGEEGPGVVGLIEEGGVDLERALVCHVHRHVVVQVGADDLQNAVMDTGTGDYHGGEGEIGYVVIVGQGQFYVVDAAELVGVAARDSPRPARFGDHSIHDRAVSPIDAGGVGIVRFEVGELAGNGD